MKTYGIVAGFVVALSLLTLGTVKTIQAQELIDKSCKPQRALCAIETVSVLPQATMSIPEPVITLPDWMRAATSSKATKRAITTKVTYSVETKGTVTANLAEFKQQAAQTYSDSRGWSRLGASFTEVPSGGMFTLVLIEAAQLDNYGGCSSDYSCRVGDLVLINQD